MDRAAGDPGAGHLDLPQVGGGVGGVHVQSGTLMMINCTVRENLGGEVGGVLQKRREALGNPPVPLPVWALALDEPQHGQRVDDVAEGAGFEDEQFHADREW